jgi:hypothetical protein
MDKIKVIGGVAAGIGTVAALPVMGAIGTVSILGAIIGGTVGGIAGAAVAGKDSEDSCLNALRSKDEGRRDCLAELDEFDGDLEAAKAKLAEKLPENRRGAGFGLFMSDSEEEPDVEDEPDVEEEPGQNEYVAAEA